jgi:hypothetical protein
MLFYLLLDFSSSIIYWIIKNLGLSVYYSISYLFLSNELSEEGKEKKKLLELLIEQKEDIDKIKKIIMELEKK